MTTITQLRDQLDMLVATITDTLNLLEPHRYPLPGVGPAHHTQWLRNHLHETTASARSVLIYCHQIGIQS